MKFHFQSIMLGVLGTLGLTLMMAFQMPLPSGLTPAQKAVLDRLSVVQIPDGQGGTVEALRVTSNFQVVNGLGSTASNNALGNLIVGYHEETGGNIRPGSHNLIVGELHSYESYGGIISGISNIASAPYATAVSSINASINGILSATLGSRSATVSNSSVVVGGEFQTVDGFRSVIVGGSNNDCPSNQSVIIGGDGNDIVGAGWATLMGGSNNLVTGEFGALTGGQFNTVSGARAVVSGGLSRSATGTHDWVAGTLFEDN